MREGEREGGSEAEREREREGGREDRQTRYGYRVM